MNQLVIGNCSAAGKALTPCQSIPPTDQTLCQFRCIGAASEWDFHSELENNTYAPEHNTTQEETEREYVPGTFEGAPRAQLKYVALGHALMSFHCILQDPRRPLRLSSSLAWVLPADCATSTARSWTSCAPKRGAPSSARHPLPTSTHTCCPSPLCSCTTTV